MAAMHEILGRLGYAGETAMSVIRNFLSGAILVMLYSQAVNFNSEVSARQPPASQSVIDGFLAAAQANDVDKLTRGLAQGIPVDSRDKNERTALLLATYANAIAAARLLIQAGADVNAKDNLHDSPYLYAGAEGKLEILKMTVAAGADLKSINRYGGTALTPAAHHGHADVVAYLVTTKVDIDQVNFLGWTALLEAVILGDGGSIHQKIIKILLDAGADKKIADNSGKTPLQLARNLGFKKIVALLEQHGN